MKSLTTTGSSRGISLQNQKKEMYDYPDLFIYLFVAFWHYIKNVCNIVLMTFGNDIVLNHHENRLI